MTAAPHVLGQLSSALHVDNLYCFHSSITLALLSALMDVPSSTQEHKSVKLAIRNVEHAQAQELSVLHVLRISIFGLQQALASANVL